MKNRKYQINIESIVYAVIKIGAVVLLAQLFGYYFEKELYQEIKWGHSKIMPMNLLILYVCLFITIQLTRILRESFWEYYLPKKRNIRISTLLIGIFNCAVYLSAIFAVLKVIFGLELGSALAATGAVGVVLGFGLQKIFLDLFIGISLDMDKSFRLGDWLMMTSAGNTYVGEVTQMSWRVITLQTAENVVHQIPNSMFGLFIVTNLSRPSADSEFEMMYCVPHNYNEKSVIRAVMRGLDAVATSGLISDYKCRITKTDTAGVHYKIKYLLNPAKCGPGKMRHMIHSQVFRFLRAEKIKLASTDQRIYIMNENKTVYTESEEIAFYISQIDLFQSLKKEQILELASSACIRFFNRGDEICTQGEDGRSLFIVREGLLRVFINIENNERKQVAVLTPEDFFGEMSLLTGDKRSATVTADSQVTLFEIDAEALIPLFTNDPKFPQVVSKIITDRNASNNALLKTPEEEEKQVSKLKELEMKIKNFSKRLLGLT